LLERSSTRHDGGAAALYKKPIERQTKAPLTAVSRDRCSRIGSPHQRCDGGGADAPRLCFTSELPFPRLEASRCAAALRGARFAAHPHERHQYADGNRPELPALIHQHSFGPTRLEHHSRQKFLNRIGDSSV
jgi:hypothetical protein